ncbi:MAG TPA: hypothetical protein VLK65_01935 [Vicinamibacteria bacterium]|nr:hypothetical protein [Vicinamibacteria bacterium]
MRCLGLVLVLSSTTASAAQDCPPCAPPVSETVASVKRSLEEAFQLAVALTDCGGASNLNGCRRMEALLSDSFAKLEALIAESREGETSRCLGCDLQPHVAPLAAGLLALSGLLQEKGYQDFAPTAGRMQQEVELWRIYVCCGSSPADDQPGPLDRERDARTVLMEKCGPSFASNRRGLRQTIRAPGEREGCYQSRACRENASEAGLLREAGFWTYDGEYWYIWAERRTPRGDWVSCAPGD